MDSTSPALSTAPLTAQQITRSLDISAFTRRHLSLYLMIVLAHLFDGFDINMIGLVLPGIATEFKLPPVAIGYLASSVFIGMLVGSIAIGTLADKIGRKRSLIFAVGFYGVTSLLAAFAWDARSLLVIRIIEGFGLGAEVPLVFTYLSEFMPERPRGVLLASSVFFWQAASFVAALTAIYVVPAYSWRAMFIVGAIPSFVLIAFFARLPESVRFLIARGRTAEAERIVRWLSTVRPEEVEAVNPASGTALAGTHTRLRDLLRRGYLRATLGVWIMQFCGGAVFVGLAVWLPSIFVRMGFPMVRGFYFTAAITGAGALGNIGAGLLLDRIGRRATLAAFLTLGGLFMLAWGLAESGPAIVALGALTAFFGAGGAGGPLFTYTSEIYPTSLRGTGTGWAAGCQRIGGIVAPVLLGSLLASHASAYAFFVVMALALIAGGMAALLLGFETSGKSLEDISMQLRS
ncbi:MAG TPA: MFS transporter [Acetobacteraceae bacterium]